MTDAGAADSFPGNSALFTFKQKITDTTGPESTKNVKTMVPMKHLSNVWITLEQPLINCEINFTLTLSKSCIISNAAANQNTEFAVTDTKLCVPVVTLSTQDIAKLLQQLKSGLKGTVIWNRHLSKVSTQASNRYLNYLIDPSFKGVNRPFILTFHNNAK